MKDRKALQEELNRVNQLYQDKDLELRKVGGSDIQRQKMRDMLNSKKESIMAEMGDDLHKLNLGGKIKIAAEAPKSGIGKVISKVGSVAKKLPFKKLMAVLGPVGAAIGTASDAMASDDLGAGEDAEVLKMRQEARMPKDQQLEDIKAKMAAMASKPLSPQDMLQNTAKPMIKQLGGPADVNPKQALSDLGEQDSPDYESGLDPVKEIARRKKLLGY
jgi:hypothetical protein